MNQTTTPTITCPTTKVHQEKDEMEKTVKKLKERVKELEEKVEDLYGLLKPLLHAPTGVGPFYEEAKASFAAIFEER